MHVRNLRNGRYANELCKIMVVSNMGQIRQISSIFLAASVLGGLSFCINRSQDFKDAFFTVNINFPACMSDYIHELYEILSENSLLSTAIQ